MDTGSKINPAEDGITHINIYSKGATKLGRMLTNLYNRDFVVSGFGKFKSMEGFWYYFLTGCKHEEFHELKAFDAKKLGRSLITERIDKDRELTPAEKEIILEAIRCKLRQHKDILEELYKSELPFEHYYYYGDRSNAKVVECPQFSWMTEEFERIRALLKIKWRRQ